MTTSKADGLGEPFGPYTLRKSAAQLLRSFPEVALHQKARSLDRDDAQAVPASSEGLGLGLASIPFVRPASTTPQRRSSEIATEDEKRHRGWRRGWVL